MNKEATTIVTEFLQAWCDMKIDKMYQKTNHTWKSTRNRSNIKDLFPKRIKSYQVISTSDINKCMCDVTVKVRIAGKTKTIVARCLKETEAYKASIDGEWGVNPISAIRGLDNRPI